MDLSISGPLKVVEDMKVTIYGKVMIDQSTFFVIFIWIYQFKI